MWLLRAVPLTLGLAASLPDLASGVHGVSSAGVIFCFLLFFPESSGPFLLCFAILEETAQVNQWQEEA